MAPTYEKAKVIQRYSRGSDGQRWEGLPAFEKNKVRSELTKYCLNWSTKIVPRRENWSSSLANGTAALWRTGACASTV